mmetsp:Transcript_54107/g.128853  ORF Transcript_54107/g.128853 Transcript_54107/m.128853 type:complete len:421 (+) Transcript_54107:207-1469(+)|eukprot:CAMPEP_0178414018 /NCGR_PEP_ID=MMETSP0689_2-20121128/22822_1 /TAXON_ID=160604 /ORGANISM="Amphidinium massartii, Strain CS-259" /LENGTH=420 /DNA_ID=CAMNT_0020035299 /DNA_START=141 /DNA_END=1403 /DNA_ORIENTATION=+
MAVHTKFVSTAILALLAGFALALRPAEDSAYLTISEVSEADGSGSADDLPAAAFAGSLIEEEGKSNASANLLEKENGTDEGGEEDEAGLEVGINIKKCGEAMGKFMTSPTVQMKGFGKGKPVPGTEGYFHKEWAQDLDWLNFQLHGAADELGLDLNLKTLQQMAGAGGSTRVTKQTRVTNVGPGPSKLIAQHPALTAIVAIGAMSSLNDAFDRRMESLVDASKDKKQPPSPHELTEMVEGFLQQFMITLNSEKKFGQRVGMYAIPLYVLRAARQNFGRWLRNIHPGKLVGRSSGTSSGATAMGMHQTFGVPDDKLEEWKEEVLRKYDHVLQAMVPLAQEAMMQCYQLCGGGVYSTVEELGYVDDDELQASGGVPMARYIDTLLRPVQKPADEIDQSYRDAIIHGLRVYSWSNPSDEVQCL